jgi:hypothetical protein
VTGHRVFHTTLEMGPGPLELGILAAFSPDWEFLKFIILKIFVKMHFISIKI